MKLMKAYQRTTPIKAIQFFELDFHKEPMKYISVLDKAMASSIWATKTVKDGRYYIMNQTNTEPFSSTTDVGEGDYVIHDDGCIFVMPKENFERVYLNITEHY